MDDDFDYSHESDATFPEFLQIGIRTDPSLDNPISWAVVLYFEQEDGTRVEIAKVDNSEHDEGDIHVDRYYRDDDAETKDFETDLTTPYEADAYLDENSERFAQKYADNHPDDFDFRRSRS